MKQGAIIQTTIEILQACFDKKELPFSQTISKELKKRRYIGSKDRKQITENLWDIIRNYYKLDFILESSEKKARDFVISYLWFVKKRNLEELFNADKYCPEALSEEEKQFLANKKEYSFSENIKSEMPLWLFDKLKKQDFTKDEFEALNSPAKTDLNILTSNIKPKEFLKILDDKDIKYEKLSTNEDGIRLKERTNLGDVFKKYFQIQDEGSQIICKICAPKTFELICDYCAGAMGKTINLLNQLDKRGKLYAFDNSKERLEKGKKRLKEKGFKLCESLVVDELGDIAIEKYKNQFDKILVDAPCSGTGTFRRNPDAKIRLSEKMLEEVKTKQAQILQTCYNLLKKEGLLIYATCSLLREENQSQVYKFLEYNKDCVLLDINEILSKVGLDIGFFEDKMMSLSPYKNQTDGFFCAVIKKC